VRSKKLKLSVGSHIYTQTKALDEHITNMYTLWGLFLLPWV